MPIKSTNFRFIFNYIAKTVKIDKFYSLFMDSFPGKNPTFFLYIFEL